MPRVVNRLPALLRAQNVGWTELARRCALPAARLRRLRRPDANPSLDVAVRIARTLGVPVERLWSLADRDA